MKFRAVRRLFGANRRGLVKGPATVTGTKHLLDDGTFAEVTTTGIAASQSETNTGTEAAKYVAPLTLHGYVNPLAATRAPRQGIVSTGATFGAQTAVSPAFGTADFSLFAWIRPDDATPAADRIIARNNGSNLGWVAYWRSNGRFRIIAGNGVSNALSWEVATAIPSTDGEMGLLTATFDRDGLLTVKWNGASVGTVDISASAAQTFTSSDKLSWAGDGGTNFPGTLSECGLVNGLLTDAQITAMVRNATAVGLGLTMYQHLVFLEGGGRQTQDISGNNNHANIGGTGISWTHPTRTPKPIRATLAASTSAQQITGASVIPTGWEILRIRAKAASGTPNIIIGNVSGGTQVVTSEALSTSWKALTIAGGIHITSTANLWATLDSAVAVELEFDIQPRGDL